MSGFYYAVAKGRVPGIYHTWEECKAQVHKFSGPKYKKFPSSEEAQAFINEHGCISSIAPSKGPVSSAVNSIQRKASTPEDLVRLGGRETKSKSKRVWKSGVADDEKPTVASAKRKKRVVSESEEATGNSSGSKSDENKGQDIMRYVERDSEGFVIVYTDGACSSNGYHGAKAGIGVFFGPNSTLNTSEPVVGRATNNMAEIQAVTRAAEIAYQVGIYKLSIHTDSEFLINCITKWMPGWKRRGWTTAAGKPVINKEELQEMERALEPLTVKWVHVRGHQGNYGNEMADKLARDGAERY